MKALLVCSLFLLATKALADLEQQNLHQHHLNPINDQEYDIPSNEQDKRTIFSNNIKNYGWAKHIAINPQGRKIVLGYSPVDLKYLPVARPISIRPINNNKQINHPKPPLILKPVRPKPIYGVPSGKPVVPINVPPPPPPHLSNKPWQQEVWNKPEPVPHPVPVAPVVPGVQVKPIIPVKPLVPSLVPVRPAVPALLPVKPIVPVGVPAPPLVPIRPALPPHLVPLKQHFIPSPLFEVTKPNLGVLPLGASFPSTLLTGLRPAPNNFLPIPPPHTNVALPHHPLPQPPVAIPQPVLPDPRIVPNSVFLEQRPDVIQQFPLNPAFNVFPLHPRNPHQPLPPAHEHPHVDTNFFQQLPLPNPHQNFAPSQHQIQQLPDSGNHLFNPHNGQTVFQQQLPEGNPQIFNQFQHLPQENNDQIFNQPQQQSSLQQQQQQQQEQLSPEQLHQLSLEQHQLSLEQHQLSLEQQQQQQQQHQLSAEHQQQFNQQSHQIFQQGNSNFLNQVSIDHSGGSQSIQPGETDVDLPKYLPSHPFLNNAFRGIQEQGHNRPSISLEPPFHK